jgi:hypothetical protein
MRESAPRPEDPETIDRNWNELLQEIRVIQTGVQILTGFLLTVPFADRFAQLDAVQRATYLAVLAGSAATTACVVAPVAFHRVLFRRRERRWMVEATNRCAEVGLTLMALTVGGVLFLVFDVVAGVVAGAVAFVAYSALSLVLWLGVPWRLRRAHRTG